MGKLQKEIDSSISELITYISSYNSFTSKGNYYKSNGILYRFGLLRRSFELFFPSLEELPKNSYECETVNVMLNSIYLHIRGILDNTAWLLYYDLELQNLNIPRDIDFSGNNYLKAIQTNKKIEKVIQDYSLWMKELKEKRDPIAHKLPLYIPAKFIDNEEDLKKAIDLKKLGEEKRKVNDETWIQDEFASMYVGDFKPVIMNLDTEKEMGKIYPILPEIKRDIENFSNFIFKIFNNLKSMKSEAIQ